MRSCGTCTMCCKVVAVSALDKPGGQWCRHCERGVGCGIYPTRPDECRSFGCLWLADPAFPAEMQPSKSKVVFAIEFGGARVSAHVDPDAPTAWRKPETLAILRRMAAVQAARRGQVIVFIRNRTIAILPDREVDLGVTRVGDEIIYQHDPVSARIEVTVRSAD